MPLPSYRITAFFGAGVGSLAWFGVNVPYAWPGVASLCVAVAGIETGFRLRVTGSSAAAITQLVTAVANNGRTQFIFTIRLHGGQQTKHGTGWDSKIRAVSDYCRDLVRVLLFGRGLWQLQTNRTGSKVCGRVTWREIPVP